MTRPLALLTNDDGIRSPFLEVLIPPLQKYFEVAVAAPDSEKSWVGRGMTRHGKVMVAPFAGFPCPAWSIGGTPSDCVNIAIGHLLERQPDVVVSGINIGSNVSEPLIFNSGTVAGALEAAVWRIPALAVSKQLPRNSWEYFSRGGSGGDHGEILQSLYCDGVRSAIFAKDLLAKQSGEMIVHNLNFPSHSDSETRMVEARPAPLILGSLFEKRPEGYYEFTFAQGKTLDDSPDTDISVLKSGCIAHSVLNFSAVSQHVSTL